MLEICLLEIFLSGRTNFISRRRVNVDDEKQKDGESRVLNKRTNYIRENHMTRKMTRSTRMKKNQKGRNNVNASAPSSAAAFNVARCIRSDSRRFQAIT